MSMTRCVVLLCGPPGAGKTTVARESGLQVFDRDDPQWVSESHFRTSLTGLAAVPHSRAVVIRWAASSASRRAVAATIRATHVYLLLAPRSELAHRIALRSRADARNTHAALNQWFARFDRDDGAPDFPGWDVVLAPPGLGMLSEDW